MTFTFTDTHTHLDVEDFKDDLHDVIQRAKDAGISKVFVPAIDLKSADTVLDLCRSYPGYAYPMLGLHPEEVRADYKETLSEMKKKLVYNVLSPSSPLDIIAIGEVGLDYYWSREYEKEQLDAFEEQVKWSIEKKLPLMIHCRKAQNELVKLLNRYRKELVGGVFHCFTGNEKEAAELLSFDNFALGIGGVLTFNKSNLPHVLPDIPIERIVLETDSPYMSPVPMRGKRNESAFTRYVLSKVAECYGISEYEVAQQTEANVRRIFGL